MSRSGYSDDIDNLANEEIRSLQSERDDLSKMNSDGCALLAKAYGECDRLAGDALAILSANGIATPEKGYIHEPHMLALDIKVLARERDNAREALQRANEEIARLLRKGQSLHTAYQAYLGVHEQLQKQRDEAREELHHTRELLGIAESALLGFNKHCIQPECQCWACEALATLRAARHGT